MHHAGVDEQQVGVVENHRGTRHLGVARAHEMIQEPLPDLVCLHLLASYRLFLPAACPATISTLFGGLFDCTTVPAVLRAPITQNTSAAGAYPSRNDNRTERRGLSRFRSTSTTLCQVPS